MTYNFYAQPRDPDDLVIVTPQSSIHFLKFILLASGKYSIVNDKHSTYDIINSPLTQDCIVEEHHYYKILKLGWKKKDDPDNWYDEDTIPFSHMTDPNKFIVGIKEFLNKEFIVDDFISKLKSDSDFKYITELLLGNDIDYIDMYLNRSKYWCLTKIIVKEIRTINYKNALD